MGYHHHRTAIALQVVFQPLCHFRIQMIRRLIQNQNITGRKQHRNQSQTLPLSTGQMPRLFVKIIDAKPGHHGLSGALQLPQLMFLPSTLLVGTSHLSIGKHAFQHTGFGIKLRHLWKIADHQVICPNHLPGIRLLQPRNNLQKGRLPGAIDANYTNLLILLQIKGGVIKKLPAGIGFCNVIYGQ